MEYDLLFAFALIYLLDSVTPGPAIAMVMSRGASIGLAKTLPFIVGLVLGDLVLFLFAFLGVVALLKTLGPFFLILKWIGICYLLYLAFQLWNSKPTKSRSAPVHNQTWKNFVLGLILPFGNPKAVGFYVALLPSFISIEDVSLFTALQFSLIIVVVWGATLTVYTALASASRRRLNSASSHKWLSRTAATAMVGAAGSIAAKN